ncbi:MAG: hypothetical protein ACON5K_10150 [Bacteroidia bacterium]
MSHIFSIKSKSLGIIILVLLSVSAKNVLSQSDTKIEISKDYSTFGQFEYNGLNQKEAIAATAMIFGGLSDDELEKLCPDDLKDDYKKYSKYLQYKSYQSALKNAWDRGSDLTVSAFNEYKNVLAPLSILDKRIVNDSMIQLDIKWSGEWRRNVHQYKQYKYKNDELAMSLLISIYENRVVFKPEKGSYSYSKYSETLKMYLDKSNSFDEIFNKKGKPKFLLKEDFNNINRAVNKLYDAYKGSFEIYITKKSNLDKEIRSVFNERRKQDSIERVQQAERQRREIVRDSINSLFTGIVVGESFYDGDHTIEIVKITRRGDDTLYGYKRKKITYYIQSGENDQYSILEKNGLKNNGENITGTYVKGRWAMGKIIVEEYGDDGMVNTRTKEVPRIIEIEPVVDKNTAKFIKPSGIWNGKFTETKYRKNKIHGEWNVIIGNNGMVRGVANSYYVRIKRGREYDRSRRDEISGVLSPNGKFTMKTDDGAIFTGQIIGNSVSGKWVNGTNLGGSFSGKKENY